MSALNRALNGQWPAGASLKAAFDGIRPAGGAGRPRGRRRAVSAAWRAARWHSRLVIALRVVLPVLAVMVIASMFVSVRAVPTSIGDIDLGEVGMDGTTLTMQNPSLSGFNENRSSYEVTADRALQDITNPRVVTLEGIDGRLRETDGSTVRITARDGVFDADKQLLDLSGRIVVKTSKGETAHLKSAHVDIEAQTIRTDDPIRAATKAGQIRADSMEITDSGAHMLFKGRVAVVLRFDGGAIDEQTVEEALAIGPEASGSDGQTETPPAETTANGN